MIESSKLVVVIAAGGTAGHIRPALAVGEALRARGATVTFAGSPDRVESRLVPEAGFELDTFEISGFPRKPSLELVRALVAGRQGAVRLSRHPAPSPSRRRPRRRRLRRRPDGARRPAERDPGSADRGRRTPRSRKQACRTVRLEAVPRLRHRGTNRGQGRGRRPPDSHRPPRCEPCRCTRPLRHRRRCAGRRRLRGARGRDVAQRDGGRRLGRRRAHRAARLRRARLPARSPRVCTGRTTC